MRTSYMAVVAVVIVGAIAFAGCGNGEPAAEPSTPPAAEPLGTGQAEGSLPAGQPLTAEQFVGMPLDQATSLAEEAGRQWRVGRENGVDLALTMDLVPGRVTFTVEDGVVTGATIEEEGS